MSNINDQFFRDASQPFVDVARMLIALNDKGVVPAHMRAAIRKHANNTLDVMALNIGAVAITLASSADAVDTNIDTVSKVSYTLASMAEQMRGWQELSDCFGAEGAHG